MKREIYEKASNWRQRDANARRERNITRNNLKYKVC